MSGTPRFKVYSANGEYVAACKYPEDAAALVAGTQSPGATIRDGHGTKDAVWTEGDDGQASESFDAVANLVATRLRERHEAAVAKARAIVARTPLYSRTGPH